MYEDPRHSKLLYIAYDLFGSFMHNQAIPFYLVEKLKRSNTKFLLFIFLAFLCQIANASAHSDSAKNNVFGGYAMMPIEFPNIDTKEINQLLKSAQLPALNYSTANVGFGFQLYTNRVITTFSFNKTINKNESDTHLTEVEYRSTSFNVGYSLIKSQSFSIYPYLGFKGTGLNYLYREKMPNPTTLGSYLQKNLNYKEVSNSRAHLDLGIGISHQRIHLVNFRFGYLVPLEKVRWNMDNNQTILSNSPSVNYNYYFSLIFGIGSIASDNDMRRRNHVSQ